MTTPTPAQFAAKVAETITELKDASAQQFAALIARPPQAQPCSLEGCEWADRRLARAEAAELLCLSLDSVYEFSRRARHARTAGDGSPKWLPEADEDGTWSARELVVWQALARSRLLRKPASPDHAPYRKPAQSAHRRGLSARQFAEEAQIGRRLARSLYHELGYLPTRAPDSILFPLIRTMVVRSPTPVRLKDARDMLAGAGYKVPWPRVARLIAEAGGNRLREVEPDHIGGWIIAKNVAKAGGCTPGAVTGAVRAGRLTPWARDRHGPDGRRLLFDLARIKPGTGRYRTPVDIDWVPGGGGETWVAAKDNGPLLPPVRRLLAQAGDRAVTVPEVVALLAQAGVMVPEKRAAVLLALA